MLRLVSTLSAFLAVVLLPSTIMAQNVDWLDAIEKTERSAAEYSDFAFEELGSRWIGPANYSIKFGTHRCAILGRMLGQAEAIQHLENFDFPELNASSDAFEMLEFSLTLDNWVAAARSAMDMPSYERINVWNLECVGELGIPNDLFLASEQPNAEFKIDGAKLTVYGDINVGFFESLRDVLDLNPSVEQVSLGSGGGSVRDALLAGYEIRLRGLVTTLHGNCLSACPLVFMGGVERVLWASPHRLGFHQIYTGDGNALSENDPIYLLTTRYLADMGIRPDDVISWMLSARPSEMFEPALPDLCPPNVATFVQRICGW